MNELIEIKQNEIDCLAYAILERDRSVTAVT